MFRLQMLSYRCPDCGYAWDVFRMKAGSQAENEALTGAKS
jgi:hypothetical protein